MCKLDAKAGGVSAPNKNIGTVIKHKMSIDEACKILNIEKYFQKEPETQLKPWQHQTDHLETDAICIYFSTRQKWFIQKSSFHVFKKQLPKSKKTDKSIVVKVNKVCQRLTVSTNFDYMLQ